MLLDNIELILIIVLIAHNFSVEYRLKKQKIELLSTIITFYNSLTFFIVKMFEKYGSPKNKDEEEKVE